MEMKSQGYITFDASTPDEFIDLVQETLNQSEFIEADPGEVPNHPDDGLVLYELE